MLNFDRFIEALRSTDGLRVTYCVIFVALILTFYELYMFYFVIVPTVSQQVDQGIEKIGLSTNKEIKNNLELVENSISEIRNELLSQKLIVPSMITFVDPIITKVVNNSKKDLNNLKEILLTFFKTLKNREAILLNKINDYTKFTAIVLLIVLILILFRIKRLLYKRNENIGTCTWVLIFITLSLIGIFQYIFYVYGQKYKYLGQNDKELLYFLANNIQ